MSAEIKSGDEGSAASHQAAGPVESCPSTEHHGEHEWLVNGALRRFCPGDQQHRQRPPRDLAANPVGTSSKLVSECHRSDAARMRVELRVEAGPRECTQADVSHARDSFFLTAHPYRRHIELNHVDCGYVGSFPAAIPFPVTDIDAAIEEHLGRSPT